MYIYQSPGPQYQYIFTPPDGSVLPPTVLVSETALSSTALGEIATALCGGTPPMGYTISQDGPPGVVTTY